MSPGVRRDLRLLPRRRGHARLPASHRPRRRADRARRGVLQGEPALARARRAPGVLAGRGARPRRRRAVARRAAPAAGPRPARAREGGVHRVARELRRRPTRTGRTTRRSRTRSPRATRRPATASPTATSRRPRATATAREEAGRGRGRGLRARARLGRDRRDHVLHEHVEPVGDDRRRPAREEGRRARPRAAAVGQVLPRAGLEGRDRVLPRLGLDTYLDELGFNTVGYGCTTCIGNSGPLPERDQRRGRGRRPRRRAPSSPATATSRRGSTAR